MKPTYFLLRSLLVLAIFLFCSNSSQGQQLAQERLVNEIRFAGTEGDLLLFDLQLNSLPDRDGILRIRDENRAIIFEERIKGPVHRKRYKILRETMSGLQFEVIQDKRVFERSFRLRYRLEEYIDVTQA